MRARVQIPTAAEDRPAWSRVGLIAATGFVLGVAWPKLTGIHVGPNVPGDLKGQPEVAASAAAAPPASAVAPALAAAAPAPSGSAAAAPTEAPAAAALKETVVVGPGKIVKCADKKNKKIADCGELQLDPVAVPKLESLAECASAVGVSGKLVVGFEIDFEKKEVHVVRSKKDKPTVPAGTVGGIVKCAGKAFGNVPLEDVPHKYRHYTVQYGLTFYAPGSVPEKPAAGAADGEEPAAGSTTSESGAEGAATVSWDTALVRKDPKDGEVVMRLVRGTKVKIVGKRNDWYKIDSGGKTGWIYRGAIGL
ncbi:MAG TPA: SH3 domain-containing protein [Polyangium sp.]|nr:SH3 domain-containing protein [Polyangium sp.]